jgi:adenylate kinase
VVTGVDPSVMGLGMISASRRALAEAELDIGDLDLVEANEALHRRWHGHRGDRRARVLIGLDQERKVGTAVRLVLIGPPGAGKGTQAARLSERLGVPHISTGDLFRANISQRTSLGLEAKRTLDAGDLVDDEVSIAMVRERLAEDDASNGFILDGFPRTVAQAEALAELLDATANQLDAVVVLEVPEDTLVQRLLERGREDDTEDVIRRRQQVYCEETAPLLDHYRKQLVSVAAVGDIEGITDRVVATLPAS